MWLIFFCFFLLLNFFFQCLPSVKCKSFPPQKVIITATSVTGRLTRSRHIYTHFARVILDTKRRAVGCYRLHVFEIASMYIHHNTSSLTEREREKKTGVVEHFPKTFIGLKCFFSPSDYPMGWHLKKSETAQEKERGKYIYIYRKMTNIFRRWPFMSNCHSFRNKKETRDEEKRNSSGCNTLSTVFPPSSSANAPQRERDKCAQVYSLCKSD